MMINVWDLKFITNVFSQPCILIREKLIYKEYNTTKTFAENKQKMAKAIILHLIGDF